MSQPHINPADSSLSPPDAAHNNPADIDGANNDVGARRRKIMFVVGVILIAALAVASFLMLGITLREFLIFDANRTQAREQAGREMEQLRQTIAERNAANDAVGEELAKREALLASRQQAVEELKTLSEQVTNARNDLKRIRDEFTSEQRALSEQLAVRVDAARKSQQESEHDAENAKSTLSGILLNVQTQRTKLDNLTSAVTNAEGRAAKLKEDIASLEKANATAQATVDALQTTLANATNTDAALTTKIKARRDELAQVEAASDEMRASRDTVAAQAAAAQEIVKAKSAEKAELETSIADLTKQKQKLETERMDLEKTKQGLEAEIVALQKTKADEPAKTSNEVTQ